jgi:hypothetical protein
MVAVVFDNEIRYREVDCQTEREAAQYAIRMGLDLIVHYPLTSTSTGSGGGVWGDGEKNTFVIYLSSSSVATIATKQQQPPHQRRRMLAFCKNPAGDSHRNHTHFWTELYRWVANDGAVHAYPVLTERRLPPDPNGGSRNSSDIIRDWINGLLDSLTSEIIRLRIAATGYDDGMMMMIE